MIVALLIGAYLLFGVSLMNDMEKVEGRQYSFIVALCMVIFWFPITLIGFCRGGSE
jgi:hypothetical protein